MIDFKFFACFNNKMINQNRRGKLVQNFYPYLNTGTNFKSSSRYYNYLLKKLKKKEHKENKEKFIFFMGVISVLVISGIIISF